jgi:hypothetical protein
MRHHQQRRDPRSRSHDGDANRTRRRGHRMREQRRLRQAGHSFMRLQDQWRAHVVDTPHRPRVKGRTNMSTSRSPQAKARTRVWAVSIAALAVLALNGGQAMAAGASSGTWPTRFPLPTNPGTVVSQTSSTAVLRSTATVQAVQRRLDNMYVTRMGCTRRLAVNKPRDYLCHSSATGTTDEVVFTFAALDPTPGHPARSQSNAYHFKG